MLRQVRPIDNLAISTLDKENRAVLRDDNRRTHWNFTLKAIGRPISCAQTVRLLLLNNGALQVKCTNDFGERLFIKDLTANAFNGESTRQNQGTIDKHQFGQQMRNLKEGLIDF